LIGNFLDSIRKNNLTVRRKIRADRYSPDPVRDIGPEKHYAESFG
jgi:hypothetical protein